MSQTVISPQREEEKPGLLARWGAALADWSEKWFPDAYIFAVLAVVLVAAVALMMGRTPSEVAVDFGKSFWSLVPFTMQMAFVIITGYVVAVSKPVKAVIVKLAGVPSTPKMAVAYVALVAMLASLLSWGFSLVLSGFLIREISKRVKGVDYRAVGAAGYLGLCSIWALGLSSSAALMMATKNSIPPALYKISGVIGLEMTLFTWQNLVMLSVLIILSCWICYVSAPSAERAKTAEMAGIHYKEDEEEVVEKAKTPGEYLEFSPILTIIVVILGFLFLVNTFTTKGGLAALDLNIYTFMLLIVGMLFHWTPRAFLKAVAKSIP
ncbi:MAG: Short chain fatty acid transporter, partial [Anaerospora sp.]|nr:Short chain fatty acid transporter [Anaerospora sp.]